MKTGFAAFLGALIGTQGRKLQSFAGTVLFFVAVGIGMIPVYVRWIIAGAVIFLLVWWIYSKGSNWYHKGTRKRRQSCRIDSSQQCSATWVGVRLP